MRPFNYHMNQKLVYHYLLTRHSFGMLAHFSPLLRFPYPRCLVALHALDAERLRWIENDMWIASIEQKPVGPTSINDNIYYYLFSTRALLMPIFIGPTIKNHELTVTVSLFVEVVDQGLPHQSPLLCLGDSSRDGRKLIVTVPSIAPHIKGNAANCSLSYA